MIVTYAYKSHLKNVNFIELFREKKDTGKEGKKR